MGMGSERQWALECYARIDAKATKERLFIAESRGKCIYCRMEFKLCIEGSLWCCDTCSHSPRPGELKTYCGRIKKHKSHGGGPAYCDGKLRFW